MTSILIKPNQEKGAEQKDLVRGTEGKGKKMGESRIREEREVKNLVER